MKSPWTLFRRLSLLTVASLSPLLLLPFSSAGDNTTVETVEITEDGRMLVDNTEELLLDQELKKAFDETKHTLQSYKDANSKLMASSKEILDGANSGIIYKVKELEELKEENTAKAKSVDKAIRDLNARQILDLEEKLEILQERELQRRALLQEKETLEKKRRKKKKQAAMAKSSQIPEGAILKESLKDLVDIKRILEKSDTDLEEWFLTIVEEEAEELQSALEQTVTKTVETLGAMEVEATDEVATSKGGCSGTSLADAVQIVQQELFKYSMDKVGMVDHLAHAKVIHHLTSKNYVSSSRSYLALQDSWWYQYLPEDWEKGFDSIFSSDWRKWNVAIPDFVYHTVGMDSHAATAPPEAILQPSIQPGSCWPMKGKHGYVTLRLPYPVKVKAISIDHASKLLFDNKYERTSAPKDIRVFGYSPCWNKKETSHGDDSVHESDYLDEDGDSNNEYVKGVCEDGLDFDIEAPIVLHDFEYDLDGPSIQTFHISEPEEAINEGSCSEETNTCGGGGDIDSLYDTPQDSLSDKAVSVIRLEITDNWGNEDYTCIYRVRIHGDVVDAVE